MSAQIEAIATLPREHIAHSRTAQVVFAGCTVGAGAGAMFALLLAGIALHARFATFSVPEAAFVPTVIVLTFVTGVTFARLVAAGREEPPVWWRTLTVGAILPLAGFGGLLLAARLEPLGTSRADLTLPVFRLAFVSASGLVAFVCTLVAALTFGVSRSPQRALEVAAITAVTYFVFALALDWIPGFHVGGGNHAMPKVALLCNLAAGTLGGVAAFRALTDKRSLLSAGRSWRGRSASGHPFC